VIYRVFAYRASWLSATAEELFDKEFAHESEDELSVYDVHPSAGVQTHVEHYAGANCDPPRSGDGIDCAALKWGIEPDDPGGLFAARRQAHRLVQTKSESDRRSFASDVFGLIRSLPSAKVEVSKEDMRDYVSNRMLASDQEWTSFMETANVNWKKYPKAK
jgi:hypothetical protein